MKTKYTAKLLIGAATISLATFISQGNAHASEQTTGLAPAQPVNFDSINVTPDQKTFYQVLHMEGISEDQRDAYIGRIKEDPDQSQEVFVESLNVAPKAESHEDRLIELQNKNLMEANEALKALQQEDSIQNRRAAQRAVNKLTPDSANAFQKELDQINAPRDAKIKADAEAKKQAPEVSAPQIEDAPTTEVAPSPKPNETQEEQKPNVSTPEKDTKTEKTEEAKEKDTNKADAEKKPEVDKSSKTEKNTQSEKAPKVESKEQAEKATENNKGADTKKEMQPAPSTESNINTNNNAATPSAPVLPETGKVTTSTLESYWNAFKDSVNKGYAYVKDSVTKGLDYLKEQYNYVSKKYNDAKYYAELYKNHKSLIDTTVLGILNEKGTGAYISPIKIENSFNPFYKSYAQTRNFVTEGINTGKVLYTLYQNPTVVKSALAAAQAIDTAKNAFNSIFSFFK